MSFEHSFLSQRTMNFEIYLSNSCAGWSFYSFGIKNECKVCDGKLNWGFLILILGESKHRHQMKMVLLIIYLDIWQWGFQDFLPRKISGFTRITIFFHKKKLISFWKTRFFVFFLNINSEYGLCFRVIVRGSTTCGGPPSTKIFYNLQVYFEKKFQPIP